MLGVSMAKYTKMLKSTKIIFFWVKYLKVITKCCLNWILLLPYKYLQTWKLIRKCFDLVDMIQHIVAFLYLACKELTTNKNWTNFSSCNVAKGFPRFLKSFATLDVRKLTVYQVEVDDGHGIVGLLGIRNMPLILLQHFGICVRRWSLAGSVYNVPKIYRSQNHLHFGLRKTGFLFMKLIQDSSPFAFKIC